MATKQLTEAEAEEHVKELFELARVSSGKILLELTWTPEGHGLSVAFTGPDGNVLSSEAAKEVELNPFLHAHVLTWALRFRYEHMLEGASQMLQRSMQEEALARHGGQQPLAGSPDAIQSALDTIRAAAAEGRGKSDIIAT